MAAQNVIIIGASSGIGKGLAKLFAKNGFKVGITGRRKNLLDEIKNEFPQNIITSCFDITDERASVNINNLISQLGGVDIFIYSAGIIEIEKKFDWVIEKKIIETNVIAFCRCIIQMVNYFEEKGNGQIAGISSIAAIRGGSSSPVYNASKSFQSILFESMNLRSSVYKNKIVFTDIKPGYVNTDITQGAKKIWAIPVNKASKQIYKAIISKKKKIVITKRWKFIAFIIKYSPDFLFKYFTKRWK